MDGSNKKKKVGKSLKIDPVTKYPIFHSELLFTNNRLKKFLKAVITLVEDEKLKLANQNPEVLNYSIFFHNVDIEELSKYVNIDINESNGKLNYQKIFERFSETDNQIDRFNMKLADVHRELGIPHSLSQDERKEIMKKRKTLIDNFFKERRFQTCISRIRNLPEEKLSKSLLVAHIHQFLGIIRSQSPAIYSQYQLELQLVKQGGENELAYVLTGIYGMLKRIFGKPLIELYENDKRTKMEGFRRNPNNFIRFIQSDKVGLLHIIQSWKSLKEKSNRKKKNSIEFLELSYSERNEFILGQGNNLFLYYERFQNKHCLLCGGQDHVFSECPNEVLSFLHGEKAGHFVNMMNDDRLLKIIMDRLVSQKTILSDKHIQSMVPIKKVEMESNPKKETIKPYFIIHRSGDVVETFGDFTKPLKLLSGSITKTKFPSVLLAVAYKNNHLCVMFGCYSLASPFLVDSDIHGAISLYNVKRLGLFQFPYPCEKTAMITGKSNADLDYGIHSLVQVDLVMRLKSDEKYLEDLIVVPVNLIVTTKRHLTVDEREEVIFLSSSFTRQSEYQFDRFAHLIQVKDPSYLYKNLCTLTERESRPKASHGKIWQMVSPI